MYKYCNFLPLWKDPFHHQKLESSINKAISLLLDRNLLQVDPSTITPLKKLLGRATYFKPIYNTIPKQDSPFLTFPPRNRQLPVIIKRIRTFESGTSGNLFYLIASCVTFDLNGLFLLPLLEIRKNDFRFLEDIKSSRDFNPEFFFFFYVIKDFFFFFFKWNNPRICSYVNCIFLVYGLYGRNKISLKRNI